MCTGLSGAMAAGVLVMVAWAVARGATGEGAVANPATEKTADGDLIVHPINHSAVRLEFRGKQYYIDPSGSADWAKMPRADVILITHEHFDHLDKGVIARLKKEETVVIGSAGAVKALGAGQVMRPGESRRVLDATVEAVPAYNITPERLKFHPKERGDNGYVLTFSDKRVYVAGDTEGTPEMRALKNIDIALVPINLPYTMTPAEAAEAIRAFRPRIVYPYHQGRSDPQELKRLLADVPGIEVRVLPLP